MKNVKFLARVFFCVLCVAALVLAAVVLSAGSSNPSNLPGTPAADDPYWDQTAGPRGGVVIGFLRCSGGTVFALTECGGIFRSTDHGANWIHCPLASVNPDVTCAVVTPDGHIFVGTYGHGVYRSRDNGDTWTQVHGGAAVVDLNVQALAVNSEGWIYLFKDTGVFWSGDDGATWVKIRGPILSSRPLIKAAVVNSLDHLFVGFWPTNGVYRSTNGGRDWTAVNTGLTATWILSMAVDAHDRLFAGSDAIFRSVNNGASWSKVMSFPADVTFGPQVLSLAVTPAGHLFAGTFMAGVYRSTNRGATWALANTGLSDLWVSGVGSDDGGYVFAGTNGGPCLYRSKTTTINWKPANRGLVNSYVTDLAFNSSGRLFAGTSYYSRDAAHPYGSGMFCSTDEGAHWLTRGLAGKNVRCIAINASGHIFVGTENDGIMRSTNLGLTWTAVNSGLSIPLYITSLAINASGHLFAGVPYTGVYRSTDNGASWTLVVSGLSDYYVWDLIVAPGGHLFVTTNEGVFRSTDSGSTWVYVGLDDRGAYSLVAKTGGVIFAGASSSGVFYSGDDGETWSNRGLRHRWIHSMAVNSAGHVFAADFSGEPDEGGVFQSVNNGVTWKNISSGLTTGNVSSLAVSPSGYLFAGTFGGGVFRSRAKANYREKE